MRYRKVIAPIGDEGEEKKAIVTEVNLPDETIDPAWADRVKAITKYDV